MLEHKLEDRSRFPTPECGRDQDLQRELEEFLRYQEAAGAARTVTGQLFAQEPHSLEVARMIAKLRLDEQALAAAPKNTEAKMQVLFDDSDVGWMPYRLGHAREAVQSQERGLALQEALAAADPQNLRIRHEIPQLLIAAAPAYDAAGKRGQAITAVRRAAEGFWQRMPP